MMLGVRIPSCAPRAAGPALRGCHWM